MYAKTIEAYFRNLFTLLDTDPARGREILSRFVAPIVMTPEIEGPLLAVIGQPGPSTWGSS